MRNAVMSPTCSPSHQPKALPTVAPTRPKSLIIWKSPVRDAREAVSLHKVNNRSLCPAALEVRGEGSLKKCPTMPFLFIVPILYLPWKPEGVSPVSSPARFLPVVPPPHVLL